MWIMTEFCELDAFALRISGSRLSSVSGETATKSSIFHVPKHVLGNVSSEWVQERTEVGS